MNVNKKDLIFFAFFFLLCALACNRKYNSEVTECALIRSIDTLPDSSFMSGALNMQFQDDYIFFIEENSKQVIKLKSDFSDNTTIGSWGVGPTELTEPRNFFFINDTVYIIDMGSASIKSFTQDNEFIKSYKTDVLSEQRIFTKNNTLYSGIFHPELETSLARTTFMNKKKEEKELVIDFFGEPFEFNDPFQNYIRNSRDLTINDNYFYTISDNQPIIEKYSIENDSLIEKFDYSFIPIIKINRRIIESRASASNTYTTFAGDAQIYNNSIYILISQQGDNFQKNKIMKVDLIPNFKVAEIYLLPGRSYTTFCVGDDYIYAFNSMTASVEKIKAW